MSIFNLFAGRKKDRILLTEIRNILANMYSLMTGIGVDEVIAASTAEQVKEPVEVEVEKLEGWE